MATPGSYNVGAAHRDLPSELERLRAQALLSWSKEARALSWLGLQNDMSILELGSGPGFITKQLLLLVPNGTVTAVELNPTLVKLATEYLQKEAVDRWRIIEGSVLDMALPDSSFDFAFARFLFQHLADPVGAAKEVLRVLKPSGKLVISDVDDDLGGIVDPPVPEVRTILEKARRLQSVRGGDRYVGRRLCRILQAAGFTKVDLELVAVSSDSIGIEPFLPQIDPDRLLPLVRLELITEHEMEAARKARERFLSSSRPLMLSVTMLACGEKPKKLSEKVRKQDV